MKNSEHNASRRRFLQVSLLGAATLPGAGMLVSRRADAAQKITEDDPTAKALGYKEDASTVKKDAYKEGQNCANCQLYTASGGEDGWGACGAFGGKLVKAGGWCTAYVANA